MEKMRDDFPYAQTEAAMLLAGALAEMSRSKRVSLREIGRRLGYKQPVVLSHMSSGRTPIPLDRAEEIARAVELPERKFVLSVLEQRHQGIDWRSIAANEDEFIDELVNIAGTWLGDLPTEQRGVLREVVADSQAGKRWLTVAELGAIQLLRDLRPHLRSEGLTPDDRRTIRDVLTSPRRGS